MILGQQIKGNMNTHVDRRYRKRMSQADRVNKTEREGERLWQAGREKDKKEGERGGRERQRHAKAQPTQMQRHTQTQSCTDTDTQRGKETHTQRCVHAYPCPQTGISYYGLNYKAPCLPFVIAFQSLLNPSAPGPLLTALLNFLFCMSTPDKYLTHTSSAPWF